MPSVKKCETEWPADTNQVGGDFCWQPATFDHSVGVLLHSPICHLHTSYIAPYLPSKFCIAFVFHFSWVLTAVPRELKDNGYAIFFLWGARGTNKVHHGRCASGILILTSGQLTANQVTDSF